MKRCPISSLNSPILQQTKENPLVILKDYQEDKDESSETVTKPSGPTDKTAGNANKVEDVSEAFDQLFNS